LQKIIEGFPDDLTEHEKAKAEDFVLNYSDAFSQSEFDIGRTKLIPHTIDTGNNRPVRQQLRRHPRAHLEFIDQEVQKMLDHNIIEESASPWSSNVVLVAKKNGKLRFCIDFRRLNALTYKDSYPIPRIDTCLDALGGAKYFSTLDLRSGYWQVEIEDSDRDKTAFVTRMGQFRFQVLPFGLCNAVSVFQRLVDHVLTGLNWFSCLCYLDDICVFSTTFDEHVFRLARVIERIREAGLKFNPEKCCLFQRRIKFLGYEVSQRGIEPDSEKVEVIKGWPVPRDLSELRSWLGLIGYYRRWIANFSARAKPLFDLAKKGVNFHWSVEQQKSFNDLKYCLTSAPILGLPDDDGQFILDTDCSNQAAGAVLSQQQLDGLRVIAYASRTLRGAELNYSTTRKELTAAIFGLKQFKQYLLGRHFVLRTDHAALTSLMKTPEVIGQQARYLDYISQFDFEIIHRPGTSHGNCDSLSRRPLGTSYPETESELDGSISGRNNVGIIRMISNNPEVQQVELYFEDLFLDSENNIDLATGEEVFSEEIENDLRRIESRNFISDEDADVISAENITRAQNEDPDLKFIISRRKQGLEPPTAAELATQSEETNLICEQWESLVVLDETLYRMFEDVRKNNILLQVIVPRRLRKMYVRHCHTGMTGGHQGVRKTREQVARRAYFPSWKNTVDEVCRTCEECAKYHRGRPPKQGPLQIQEAACVMDQLAVDLTGPHPTSSKGHVYIMTAVDIFSRFLIAVPIRNKTALTVAEALYQRVFCIFGTVRQLKTDLGREFENELLTSLCNVFGIKKLRTSAYHASANGRVERSHRTLNSIIAKVVSENQRNWHEVLNFAVAAYNASFNESTKYSPNFLMFGREVLTPFDVIAAKPLPESELNIDSYVADLRDTMENAYRIVRNNTHVAARQRKKIYDSKIKRAEFAAGNFVWVYHPRAWKGRSPKWTNYYSGPFRVERRMNAVMYVVKRSPSGKPTVVHVDKLKPFHGEVSNQWKKYQADVDGSNRTDIAVAGTVAKVVVAGQAVESMVAGSVADAVVAGRTVEPMVACQAVESMVAGSVADAVVAGGNETSLVVDCSLQCSCLRHNEKAVPVDKPSELIIANCQYRTMNVPIVSKKTFTCPYVNDQGDRCGTVYNSRSGIWRHSITVHGCRHYANGEMAALNIEEQSRIVNSVRQQQRNCKTVKRNDRRRRRTAERTKVSNEIVDTSESLQVVDMCPSLFDLDANAAVVSTVKAVATDEPSGIDGGESWNVTDGGVDEGNAGLGDLLTQLAVLFEVPETNDNTDRAVESLPFDIDVATMPTTNTVEVQTAVCTVREVGVRANVLMEQSEEVARSYERPIVPPGRVTFDELCRVFRVQPDVSPDVLARRAVHSTILGRPLSGQEHELAEFAFRAMAAMERHMANELRRVYSEVQQIREPDHARHAFNELLQSFSSRPVASDPPGITITTHRVYDVDSSGNEDLEVEHDASSDDGSYVNNYNDVSDDPYL
jgi:hypothetical protein